jgi:hypothetical protein
MPIIGKHNVHPYSNAVLFHSDHRRDLQPGRRARLPVSRTGNRLVDQHLLHACFRRTSPERFWFRGLWRKPGQRFAVCGRNPAWQIPRAEHDENHGRFGRPGGARKDVRMYVWIVDKDKGDYFQLARCLMAWVAADASSISLLASIAVSLPLRLRMRPSIRTVSTFDACAESTSM